MKLKFLALAVIANLIILASPVVGATFITPKSVEASSTIKDVGLDKANLINGELDGELHDTDFANMWLSDSVTATLTFDLGDIYGLGGAYVWQYNPGNGSTGSGVKQFDILTSLDDILFTPVLSATLAQGDGVDGWFSPELKVFTKTARYVKFSILSNYNTSSSYSGLSEVRFKSGLPVPEPDVTSLLALAVLGLLALRGKNHFFSQKYGAAPIELI